MLEFQMFRMKVLPSDQGDLFRSEMTRPQILSRVLKSLPESILRGNSLWHIGNLDEFEEDALYFRLGRTTTSTVERYQNGNFVDEPFQVSPYTHVVIDLGLELVVIARKPKLSPSSKGIANALTELLNRSSVAVQLNARFEIGEISDPEEFVERLASAYNVRKFWVSFGRPNPFDAERDFQQPMQRLLAESDGEAGKTELKGENLRPEMLQAVARSAAATGDDAGATLMLHVDGQWVKKSLRQNLAVLEHEEVAESDDKVRLLHEMRDLYRRIRGRNPN